MSDDLPADEPLDRELVASVMRHLADVPSDLLLDMVAGPAGADRSPEALYAARVVLTRRANGYAAEPECRNTPRPAAADTGPVGGRAGEVLLAPRGAAPHGMRWLLPLTRRLAGGGLYPARVARVAPDAASVFYHAGGQGWVRRADLRPFDLDVGSAGRWRGRAGVITHVRDRADQFHVRFADGTGEWVRYAEVVVPRGPGAATPPG